MYIAMDLGLYALAFSYLQSMKWLHFVTNNNRNWKGEYIENHREHGRTCMLHNCDCNKPQYSVLQYYGLVKIPE